MDNALKNSNQLSDEVIIEIIHATKELLTFLIEKLSQRTPKE